MDRNQFIGLILMFALLAVYFTWFAPDPPPPEITETPDEIVAKDTTLAQTTIEQTNEIIAGDSVIDAENVAKYGAFAFAAPDQEEAFVVGNEEFKLTFSNLGGGIKEVALKKHDSYLGGEFKLVDRLKSNIAFIVEHQGKSIDLNALSYILQQEVRDDTTYVSYTLSNETISLSHNYIIPPKGFEVFYEMQQSGLNNVLDPVDASYQWNHYVNRAESNLDDARLNSNVRFYLANEDYDELAERSSDFEEETLGSPIKWIAFKQKFFTTAVIANASSTFSKAYVNQNVDAADTSTIKQMSMNVSIPYGELVKGFGLRYYFGTNKYTTLKKIAPEFEENLDMGWGPLPIVNKFLIIPIFNFLQGFMSNYGLIIIVIVVLIRLILSPLTYKSHMSMAKMRAMKPELDEIKEKHEGDMQKTQQEQMKLYQQVGINPLSGCIPLLLQMPILFSLFFFFPNAVELRGKAFLWAKDLSTYDSVLNLPFEIPFYGDHVSLFTLLMTISTLMTIWSNSQVTTVQGPMKTLQYVMPIMFLFVLNNYAAGLTFYYFVSNILTFAQTVLFRKLIDEDKIHKILQDNKKKNASKKKSKFQVRLEEAMKANQQAQQAKKKKR